jgi:hypothetical protein
METSRKEDKNVIISVMVLCLLAVIFYITSCSPAKQFNKLTKKHPELIKSISLKKDTIIKGKDLIIVKYDTVNQEIIKTVTNYRVDTVRVDNIITNYIPDNSCNEQNRILRKLNRKQRDSLNYQLRLTDKKLQASNDSLKISKKSEIKQTRIENRNNWWIWLIAGFIIGIFVKKLL